MTVIIYQCMGDIVKGRCHDVADIFAFHFGHHGGYRKIFIFKFPGAKHKEI